VQSNQISAGNFHSNLRRSGIAIGVGGILLLAIFVGIAFGEAADIEQDGPVPLVSPTVNSVQDLNALTSDSSEEANRVLPTDPAAAEALPHTDLDRREAEDLLVSVFPTATEDPGGIYNEIEPRSFHSDYVAVIPAEGPDEPAGLLTSLLPLRAENDEGAKEAVDLSLEGGAQGELQPANPLVEVEIPPTAAGEIELPQAEVGVELATPEGEPSASMIEGAAAFYPNVANDSDFLVVPAPTGFETFTQLRSAAAPTTQRFNLTLPKGATVEATDDGGAAVLSAGEPLVVVKPPTALDAEGEAVPVSLSVDGASVELHTTTSPETAFPVLVDPLWDNYSWKASNSSTGIGTDWRSYTSPNQSLFTANWVGNLSGTLYAGLALRSYSGSISPGTSANWNYYVPRYFSDYSAFGKRPTSFIRNMNLSQVYYVIEENPSAGQPYIIAGIWDEKLGVFHSSQTRDAHEGAWNGATLTFPNSQENTSVRNGGIALVSYNDVAFKRQVFVGQASVEVSDKDVPTWGYLPNLGVWTKNSSATAPLDYSVSDSGLGIRYLKVTRPQAAGGSGTGWTFYECTGSASDPCPVEATTAARAVTYDPGSMAQGESTISVVAQDPVGNESATKLVKVRVDHDEPTIDLSGNLTEQATAGTKLAKYTLNYTAKDGDDAAAAATAPVGTAGTNTGQLERPMAVEADSAGNIWVTDRTNNRIVKYSPNGVYLSQITGTIGTENQVSEPRDLAISANGNIWVAETTYDRVRQYSPSGAIVSTIKSGEMESPFGVAVAPDGAIWVTDNLNNKVLQFKQDGTLIRKITRPAGSTDIPFGLDIDEYGNGWIAMQGSNRVVEMSPTGTQLFAFGSEGTEDGKFKTPHDVAIAPSGNLFVTDSLNNRIQEFKPDGSFMRKFGTTGTASNQLSEPKGIAVLPGNGLAIADAANKWVARWNHADQDPQSGVVKAQVKVDGTTKLTNAPGCAAGKSCSLSGTWTLNADEYPVGSHKVEVFATDGVNFVAEKILNVETHGDLTAPTNSLSGSMTEQATLGYTLPAYTLKVAASDPGPTEERKSGVASTVIKVDGTTVDSVSPGCTGGGCSLNREWTLKSSSYAAGSHTVEVITTDAAGRVKTTTQLVQITRDTNPPALALSGPLAEAPDGWVQEGTRSITAVGTDPGGFGVKQIRFKIDGTVVGESAIQTCAVGGCSQTKTFSVDLSNFAGGAHNGVIIAEDLAGNIRNKTWTINVDPLGNISASEATDTIEAVEVTAPEVAELSPATGLVTQHVGEEGNNPGLVLQSEQFESHGTPTPSTISLNPTAGFVIDTENMSEAGTSHAESVEITPTQLGSGAGAPQATDGSAAIIPNSSNSVDTVLRPIFTGLMTFQDIRDSSGPEQYSWQVKLGGGEYLKSIDAEHAGVFWDDGTQAMLISAQAAHGADGRTVATSLAVGTGNVITLTVHHRIAGVIYPVMAGVGWEGGFQTEEAVVSEPVSNAPLFAEGEALIVSPPETVSAGEASASSSGELRKKYLRVRCAEYAGFGLGVPRPIVGKCGNPFTGDDGEGILWQAGIRGAFFYTAGVGVRHNGAISCAKNIYPKRSVDYDWQMNEAYECRYGPKTADENGGTSASAGHYLRAQAHWLLGYRGQCGDNCGSTANPWRWKDVALELHLFPSGSIKKIEPVVE
jgi:sugar lactone lactonase YvrE